jgi:hypothetical protein
MPFRWDGVECDTYEELQQLKGNKSRATAAPPAPSASRVHEGPGACFNPSHRDDCSGRRESCGERPSTRCCSKDGDCYCAERGRT